MAKKSDGQPSKHMLGRRQEKQKVSTEELFFRYIDSSERWRQEYEYYQSIENKLAAMSDFTYEEIDYKPLIVRAVFEERAIPDFSFLLENARVAAESKLLMPIIMHIIVLVILIFLLIIGRNTVLLWLSGASLFTGLLLLVVRIQARQSFIERVLSEKQQEIENRVIYEKNKIAEEKKKHEDYEDQRIRIIEGLLSGEISSIFTKIEKVLAEIKVPVNLSVEIELYNNIPSVKIWLPLTSIIPDQICLQQPSGRLMFKEKEMRAINKQYLELCSAIIIKIMSAIYSHIPTFDIGYVYGMSKEGKNIECLIGCKLERQTLKVACSAATGLEAIQTVKADFKCKTSLELLPVEVEHPEEWGNVEQKLVRGLSVNLFK